MPMSLGSLARALDRHRAGCTPHSIRYPPTLRSAAVAALRNARAAGSPLSAVVDALGVPAITLTRWDRESATQTFRRVEVASDPVMPRSGTAALVLTTSNGLRVEGLDLESLATLLRALA